jgi:hypothetical protein
LSWTTASIPSLALTGPYDYGRHQFKGALLFSRSLDQSFSLVALNFIDAAQSVSCSFPLDGDYREELHGRCHLTGLAAAEEHWLTISSNYGCIWTSVASLNYCDN